MLARDNLCFICDNRGSKSSRASGIIDAVLKARLFPTSEQFVSVCFSKMELCSECLHELPICDASVSRAAYILRIGSIKSWKGGIIGEVAD